MNLTILALQSSIISMSPLFTKVQSLNIRKSSFSYFISPLIYNVFGKIEHSSFINGLSSLVIIESDSTDPINKELASGESFEFKGNNINAYSNQSPIISITANPGALGISINQNSFLNCISGDSDGLIKISSQAKTTFTHNCFVSSYSNGASTLSINSPGEISFVTTLSEFHSNAACSFKVGSHKGSGATDFANINVSNANLLENGAILALSGSKLTISYLHFESSYNIHCFTIESNVDINFQNCEIFDQTAQISIFSSKSSFIITNSYFFGLIFNNFIESNGESLKYTFTNCGFDIAQGLIKESFITFNNCYFDVEITFTNNAEFLNFGKCDGRNFTTYESILKQFSTEEVLGMIFCVIGIVLSLIMIVAQILSLKSAVKADDKTDDQYSEFSDYDFSLSTEEEEQEEKPKKRK